MPIYRLAARAFRFSCELPELQPFKVHIGVEEKSAPFVLHPGPASVPPQWSARARGLVAGAQREVEVEAVPGGIRMKVEGCGEYFIAPHGETIERQDRRAEWNGFDRQVILGPALVLALALRGVWSLHASAAMFRGITLVFLGESGQGKSTLTAHLAGAGWRLVADDILPAEMDADGVRVLPHYPQLKLAADAQPGVGLPERLSLRSICVLEPAGENQPPALHQITAAQAARALLGHIAGTRLFGAALLKDHLEFSTRAAGRLGAYRLVYPHRRDALPLVRELLEKVC